MSKFFVDSITVSSGGTSVVLSVNVKGSIDVDKKEEMDLISGQKVIVTERIAVDVETLNLSMANYNSLRGLVNNDINVIFKKGITTLAEAKNIRLYPKLMLSGGEAIKCHLTGEKEYDVNDALTTHLTLPA